MITRGQVAATAALRTGYHRRRFVRIGSNVFEIVGGFTQHKDAYSRRTGHVIRAAGTFYFEGRRWKKNRQAWSKTLHWFTDEAINEMVDGWTVAGMEARAALKRQSQQQKT